MLQEKFIIFSAESTHKIIAFEKLLLENDIQCRIIPLPSEISSSCGLSIKLDEKYLPKANELALKNNIDLKISLVEKLGLKKIITDVLF